MTNLDTTNVDSVLPLELPQYPFYLGQLLHNRKRETIQIIGIEWRFVDVDEPHWQYVLWNVNQNRIFELHHNRVISNYLPKRMGDTYKDTTN